MSYVLAPKGELKAIVTYTAPTHTQGGAPLESISKVEIKSNWELQHTFDQIMAVLAVVVVLWKPK